MTPVKLQLHNFLSYKEPEPLDFTTFNLAILSGNNGVGKSSILEAITWALWGKTRAASDDDLIFQGQTSTWVEFIFEHEKNLYRIFRKREIKTKTGQSILEFQTKSKKKSLLPDMNWETITESSIKATSEKIIRILKIPYEIFVNSSYLRQGHADEFTVKSPAERKEILSEVLDLKYYEELSTKARDESRRSDEKIKLFAFQIDDLQIQIVRKKEVENNLALANKKSEELSHNLKKIQIRLKDLELERQNYEIMTERIRNLKSQYLQLQMKTRDLEKEKEHFENEKKIIEEQLRNKTKILHDFQKLLKLEKIADKENDKLRQFNEYSQELKVLEHIKNEIENNAKRLNQISTCPICLRALKKTEAEKIIAHLKSEFNLKYKDKFQRLKINLEKLGYRKDYHQKVYSEIQNLKPMRETKQALDLAENNLNNTVNNLNKIHLDFKNILNEAKKISKEGLNLKNNLTKFEKSKTQWEENKVLEEDMTRQILEQERTIGAFKQELAQIKQFEKNLSTLEKELEKIQNEKQSYDELCLAFGKKGIQAMIIETSIAAIEDEANQLLDKITDGRMQLSFITQKEKKSNEEELIETLEISIRDEFGRRDYEMYSGGEAFRINFAIRIALSKLLAARAGTHLKFLAIDEGFGILDASGRDDLVAAINSITPDFEKILVITHLQELKDLFPTKIEVTKDEGGSHIKVVS